MELGMNVQVVVSPEQVASQLDDELFILDTKNGRYYSLNEVGSRIWSLIQSPTLVSSIRNTLLDEYEVAESQLETDLIGILTALLDRELIKIIDEAVV